MNAQIHLSDVRRMFELLDEVARGEYPELARLDEVRYTLGSHLGIDTIVPAGHFVIIAAGVEPSTPDGFLEETGSRERSCPTKEGGVPEPVQNPPATDPVGEALAILQDEEEDQFDADGNPNPPEATREGAEAEYDESDAFDPEAVDAVQEALARDELIEAREAVEDEFTEPADLYDASDPDNPTSVENEDEPRTTELL